MTRFAVAALAVLFAFSASDAAIADPVLLRSRGVVSNGGADRAAGKIWFEFYRIDQRFALELSKISAPQDVATALLDSNHTGKSLNVFVYATSGHFDAGVDKPIYVVAR